LIKNKEMQILRVPTANGIDDIKFIGVTNEENLFIKQLAEAGTLTCISRQVSDTILFRAISVTPELSSYTSTADRSIGKYDFVVRQNQDHNVDFRFDEDAVALDLTQFSAIKLQVKLRKGSPALFSLSLGEGLTITGANHNVLGTKFTAAQTALLNCESYYYDVLMSKPTSNVYYLEGKITVKLSGTR
jgi:hypothetical protein